MMREDPLTRYRTVKVGVVDVKPDSTDDTAD